MDAGLFDRVALSMLAVILESQHRDFKLVVQCSFQHQCSWTMGIVSHIVCIYMEWLTPLFQATGYIQSVELGVRISG